MDALLASAAHTGPEAQINILAASLMLSFRFLRPPAPGMASAAAAAGGGDGAGAAAAVAAPLLADALEAAEQALPWKYQGEEGVGAVAALEVQR